VPDHALLAAAVGLETGQLGEHRAGVHEGGPRFLYIPIRSLDALSQARPVQPYWDEIMHTAAVDSAYLYTSNGSGYRTRMFSPTAGIPEDPATGSAAAILASQLLANGQLSRDETCLTLNQGIEMGRPSRIELRITMADGALSAVHVSGGAVPVASGTIRIPPPAARD
jgi:trans-2,3-dihydro-3-hydroxyanthranilate isomerase